MSWLCKFNTGQKTKLINGLSFLMEIIQNYDSIKMVILQCLYIEDATTNQ